MTPTPRLPLAPGVQTLNGACHCGHIRYQVRVDLGEGTARCNCTWCTKHGWWSKVVKPEAFTRLSADGEPLPIEPGHTACPHCHVMVYGAGDLPELGGAFVTFNVNTLEGVDLHGVSIVFLDGLHDTWAFVGQTTYENPFRALGA